MLKSLRELIARSPATSGIAVGGGLAALRISSFFQNILPGETGEELLKFVDHFGFPIMIGTCIYALGRSYKREKENKRLQQELRRKTEQLETLVNTMGDGLMLLNSKHELVMTNPAMCNMLQYTEQELLGETPEFWTAEEDMKIQKSNLGKRQQGKITRYEIRLKRKDGNPLNVFVTGSPIMRGEKHLGSVGVCKDITYLSGIAHDLNNELTAIMGYGDMLEMILKKEDPSSPNLEFVRTLLMSADKIKKISRRMLGFSGIRESIDVNEALEQVVKSFSFTDKYDIRRQYQASQKFNGDPLQIDRAFKNLVKNAIEAMPERGELGLSTRDLSYGSDSPQIRTLSGQTLKPGDYVVVSISDTGKGIRKEDISKLREIDYTTKIEGTGRGLWNASTIIRNHGGDMSVDSEIGKGSTFSSYFPVTEK